MADFRRPYNIMQDPYFQQGVSALSSMFAPPSPQALAAGMQVQATQAEQARAAEGLGSIERLYGPEVAAFARAGVANPAQQAGVAGMFRRLTADPSLPAAAFDPSVYILHGNYGNTAVGTEAAQAAAMARQQASDAAATARQQASDAATTARQRELERIRPLVLGTGETAFFPPDEAARRGVSPTLRGMFNLDPGQLAVLPDGTRVEGPAIPSTKDQTLAAILGRMSPEEQRAVAFGNTPIEAVITPEGPRNVSRPGAIGQAPYVKPGSEPTPQLAEYETPDGRTGTAVYDSVRGWIDTQTGEELPSGLKIFKRTVQGDVGAVGLTPAARSTAQRTRSEIVSTLGTAKRLRTLVDNAPGTGLFVGSIRGTLQDLFATGGEVAQLMRDIQAETQKDITEGRLKDDVVQFVRRQGFDPNIPARQALTILLATQYAKTLSPDRVSNELLGRIMSSLGEGGALANAQKTTASLDTIIRDLESRAALTTDFEKTGGKQTPVPAEKTPTAGQRQIVIQTPAGIVTIRRED